MRDVAGGAIRIDGTDIRDLTLPALRAAVATAFEDPALFSMSVAENLRLGRSDASDDDVAAAIDIAAAGFVYDLPFGLDTRIGEQGMSLSGGQRQRLSLARAIVADPAILVLDDTLSALDVHTEAAVTDALRAELDGDARLEQLPVAIAVVRAGVFQAVARIARSMAGMRAGGAATNPTRSPVATLLESPETWTVMSGAVAASGGGHRWAR